MGHQTIDAYSICGTKVILYIDMAISGLIPQVLHMSLLHTHI